MTAEQTPKARVSWRAANAMAVLLLLIAVAVGWIGGLPLWGWPLLIASVLVGVLSGRKRLRAIEAKREQ